MSATVDFAQRPVNKCTQLDNEPNNKLESNRMETNTLTALTVRSRGSRILSFQIKSIRFIFFFFFFLATVSKLAMVSHFKMVMSEVTLSPLHRREERFIIT